MKTTAVAKDLDYARAAFAVFLPVVLVMFLATILIILLVAVTWRGQREIRSSEVSS